MSSEFVGCSVADMERELIIGTLHRCGGNRTHAAKVLRISVRTLRYRIAAFKNMGVYVPTNGCEREPGHVQLSSDEQYI